MGNGKTTILYFMRHGQTEDNVHGIIQGHNDSPLTQEGITATRGRARELKGIIFDAIFCSDLERTRKTLEILMEELDIAINVNYCAEIRELDFGQYAGKNIEEVKEVILLHKKQTWKYYPDGESGDSFSKRIIDFVENVLRRYEGKAVLFMTHYGVIETILRHYIAMPDNRLSTRNYDTMVLYFNKKGVNYKWI
ncbi:MAG: histidine phosphatase family protein [Candidatus Scalindua sp.]